MGTVAFGSLYPGRPTTQEQVNAPANTVAPTVQTGAKVGVPVLIALGVLAWYLFQMYD